MNQQFSVLQLILCTLVSTINSTTVLNNVLLKKPVYIDTNHSTPKMKTIFFNKELSNYKSNFDNFVKIKELNTFNTSRINNILPIIKSIKDTELETLFQKTRHPRHVEKVFYKNNNENTSEQHAEAILGLKFENEADKYDYYDNGKYYDDYLERNINGLVDNWNLNNEINNSSESITRTLSESQERKRCIMQYIHDLDSGNLQQPQKLLSDNIAVGRKSLSRSKNENQLKSITNPIEFENNHKNNSHVKEANEDFTQILKQLIEKLDKSKSYQESLVQNSDKLTLLDNKSDEKITTDKSSEEQWVLKLEKIKENRIIQKLNSSPENTFVNGKWIVNKIIKNKSNDCKLIESDLRIELNNQSESTLTSSMKPFNFKNPKNQVIENSDNISKNLNNLQIVSLQENEDILTSTSVLPEKNEKLLISRETTIPLFIPTTSKDKLKSTINNEINKWKFTTKDYKNNFNKEDNFSKNEDSSKIQGIYFESTVQSAPTTESNEPLTFDLNNTLKIKKVQEKLENEKDNQKAGSTSVEKENNSLENITKCNCNQKIIKNILSSIMIKNITEIKTDAYELPDKIKSYKRSDKIQNKNGETYNSKKNVNDYQLKNNVDNKTKTFSRKFLHEDVSPQLKLDDQRNISNEAEFNNIDEIKTKIFNNSLPTNSKQIIENLKQHITKEKNTYAGKNVRKPNNINNMNIIKKNSINSKSAVQRLNEMNGQTSPRRNQEKVTRKNINHNDNNTNTISRKVNLKLKHSVPVFSKTRMSGNFGEYNNSTSKSLLRIPMNVNNIPLSQTISRPVEIFNEHNNNYATENNLGKLISKPYTYVLSSNIRQGEILKENNNENKYYRKINNNTGVSKLGQSSSLDKMISSTTIRIIPKSTHKNLNDYSTKIPINSENHSKQYSIPKKRKPIQLIQTLKVVNPFQSTLQTEHEESPSTFKLKKSLNYSKLVTSSPINLNEKSPKTSYNIIDKLSKSLKNENIFNDKSSTESWIMKEINTKPNLQLKYKPNFKRILPKVSKIKNSYDEYGPYEIEDFKPIIFDKKDKSEENFKKNTFRTKSNTPHYSSINSVQQTNELDDKNHSEKIHLNHSKYEVLPEIKVVDGVLKIPLANQNNSFNDNQSEIFIPIVKYDGQQSAISLTKLLNGDFHLLNELNKQPVTIESTSETDSMKILKDVKISDVSDKPVNFEILKDLQTNKENEKYNVPVHVIQIINKSLCLEDNKTVQKSQHYNEVKLESIDDRNEENKLSTIKSQNKSSGKQNIDRRKLESAYKHFDSEILDRFLQVYNPIQKV